MEATNLINEKKFEEASAVYEKYASDERMSAEEKQVLYFLRRNRTVLQTL